MDLQVGYIFLKSNYLYKTRFFYVFSSWKVHMIDPFLEKGSFENKKL